MSTSMIDLGPLSSKPLNTHIVRLSTVLLKSIILVFLLVLILISSVTAWAADSSISGKVINIDGKPLPDMIVTLNELNDDPCCLEWDYIVDVTSDSDGRYSFNGLEAGTFRIGVFDANRFPTRFVNEYYDGAFNFENATNIIVGDGEDVTEINIALEELGRVEGTTTDVNGIPIADLPITLHLFDIFNEFWYAEKTVATDASGNYSLTMPYGFSSGDVRVRFGPGYFDHAPFKYVTEVYEDARFIDDGTDIPVSVGSTTSGIDAQLVKGSVISGQVADPDGNPLSGIEMSLYSFEFDQHSDWANINNEITDHNGNYSFGRMEAGIYRIGAYDIGTDQYLPSFYGNVTTFKTATDIHIEAGVEIENINIQMAQGSFLRSCGSYEVFQNVDGEYIVPDFHGNLIIGTDGKDVLTGTDESDLILGLTGNDYLSGLQGNDTLCGGPGNDKLYGGDHNDIIEGDDGNDFQHGGKGNDILDGGAHDDDLYGDAGQDELFGGPGFNILVGGAHDDLLIGGERRDGLFGFGGNDELNGEGGNDLLNGGSGNDWLSGNAGNDKLVDEKGDDILDGGPNRDRCIDKEGYNTEINCEYGIVNGASILDDAESIIDEEVEPDFAVLRTAMLAQIGSPTLDKSIFVPFLPR